MAEFKVDTAAAAEFAARLRELKLSLTVESKIPDKGSNSGGTCEEMEQLCLKLKETKKALYDLTDKTIAFLGGVSETFDAADKASASGVSGNQ